MIQLVPCMQASDAHNFPAVSHVWTGRCGTVSACVKAALEANKAFCPFHTELQTYFKDFQLKNNLSKWTFKGES